MTGRPWFIPAVVLAILFLIVSPGIFYTISETEQAVVVQFGRPVRVIVNGVEERVYQEIAEEIRAVTDESVRVSYGAGLRMKVPFVQEVRRFESRIMEFDEDPRNILTVDKYNLLVDSYARWRVHNPLLFLKRVREEELATQTLRPIVGSEIRKELGGVSHYEIIRSTTRQITIPGVREGDFTVYQQPVTLGREFLMDRITERCDRSARVYGIRVVDVRIKRADLPPDNARSVYERMIAERNRIATRYLNEGSREAQIITSDTDRQVKVILAEAQRSDLEIRGHADAEAARIYSEGFTETLEDGSQRSVAGFGADPEFFSFTRKLDSLRKSLGYGDRLILTTDSPILEQFNSISPQE
jgi:membrane protease subunit HflC